MEEDYIWQTVETSISSDGITRTQTSKLGVKEHMNIFSAINCAPKKEPLTYQFFVSVPDLDINWEEIATDISWENPLAIVSLDGQRWEGYVMIDLEFMKMAILKDMAYELEPFPAINKQDDPFIILKCEDKKDFTYLVSWAKRVKKADWPKGVGNKGKVSVSIPQIKKD